MLTLTTILFFLIVLGIVNIISREYIFEPIRKFFDRTLIGNLITCSTCLGFWIGSLLYILTPDLLPAIHPNLYISSFLIGCISSFICKVVDIKLFSF